VKVHNGIAVRSGRLLDLFDEHPTHEAELIAAIERHVRFGDSVVVVGGGYGVATVRAAHRVGRDGDVVAFEASEEYYSLLGETVDLNRLSDRVETRHAVVGEARDVYDGMGDADVVSPSDLPECDVLVMDCEGAEEVILDGLEIEPETIIVESHAPLDAPPERVRELLSDRGYTIVNESGVSSADGGVVVHTAVRE
jgi:precorrin-6B methylase 2